MKRLLVVVLVAAALWAGYWMWQANALKSSVETWFEDRRADGWQASYADMSVKGFPNRLDLRFDDLQLADPDSRVVWNAPRFEILSLSYQPGHWIMAWPESQTLSTPADRYEITSQGLRASLVANSNGDIDRANIEAETLNITGTKGSTALAGLTIAAAHQQAQTYQFALQSDALAQAGSAIAPGSLDGLRINSLLDFDALWTLDTIKGPRPQPTRIDIKLAEYIDRGLELKLAGAVDLDSQGFATGEVTFKAANWRNVLQSAALPDGMANTLEQALTLIAGLSGNKNSVDLPIKLSAGKIRLGIIGLGKLPAIRIP